MIVKGTNLTTGTKVRICNITDDTDMFLNGLTGTITHKFPAYEFGDVGIFLDKPCKHAETCNVLFGEYEVIE